MTSESFLPQIDANETEGRKNRIRPEFQEDPSFKNRLTSYNHTAVHIPTDIYDGCKYCIPPYARFYRSPSVLRTVLSTAGNPPRHTLVIALDVSSKTEFKSLRELSEERYKMRAL